MAFKYSYMSFNFGILHTISARKARCRFCTLLISNYTYSRLLNATCFTCLVSKINFAKCFQPFQASILGVSTSLASDTFFVQKLENPKIENLQSLQKEVREYLNVIPIWKANDVYNPMLFISTGAD